ncbi:MAG: type II secretion system major pseudopilin GspG [Epsilonproteobacteria bacterium]|nr:type II secretion system major pseudopilin GspG [Campylobacterota bacterium]OIO13321.1 MAG: type II secretion system protein GspG [Helicobacteraceae bacterium CG1_02_36_14]PIP10796.1 MAG: type II secretion system protein GspG [Sulfurimonas sp. CG23_combo_of_CG06-09_8_20_14_all_36_33]PIS24257.1 MAG: type II secretion system protein GspG [Sulfurimonas sp. CG08_land_8_20_14_0_20_36_33]PIU36062.1 MAG: type II secretion system protein GspG [Sulfurimonas sp. CG07_land_8_20_14_0_80_36_56]PIV04407.
MKRKAFSLIELMIVIVILGLLAAMVMPSLTGKGEEAKRNLVCVQMKSIYNGALDMFKLNNSTYPSTEEGLEALVKNPDEEKYSNYSTSGYFKDSKLPKDSWGNNFIYINEDGTIEIISLGADKKEGGKDEGVDIKMSECK